jgi:hypothetical protein
LQRVSYVWTEQYQSAVLELDAEKLLTQIAKAEALIQQRKAELIHEPPDGSEELEAIARALQVLTQLRVIGQKCT